MEADIRNLVHRSRQHRSNSEDDEPKSKKTKSEPSPLQQELAKYSKGKRSAKGKGKGKERDEADLLAALDQFRSRLKKNASTEESSSAHRIDDGMVPPGTQDGEEAGLEVDDDSGWMKQRLEFPKDNDAETYRAEHDYDVIDPRAKARDIREEERERKRARRSEVGRAFRKGR